VCTRKTLSVGQDSLTAYVTTPIFQVEALCIFHLPPPKSLAAEPRTFGKPANESYCWKVGAWRWRGCTSNFKSRLKYLSLVIWPLCDITIFCDRSARAITIPSGLALEWPYFAFLLLATYNILYIIFSLCFWLLTT
jgi:hypothetical protein